MTKYRLAQLTGVSKQTISSLELGQSEPSWNTVQAIALALGVSLDVFVTHEPESPPAPPKRGRPRKGE